MKFFVVCVMTDEVKGSPFLYYVVGADSITTVNCFFSQQFGSERIGMIENVEDVFLLPKNATYISLR